MTILNFLKYKKTLKKNYYKVYELKVQLILIINI